MYVDALIQTYTIYKRAYFQVVMKFLPPASMVAAVNQSAICQNALVDQALTEIFVKIQVSHLFILYIYFIGKLLEEINRGCKTGFAISVNKTLSKSHRKSSL